MSGSGEDAQREAERRKRMQQAENRLVLHAAMEAKRTGQLRSARDSTRSEIVTAIGVLVAIAATLAIAFRYGS